MLTKFQRVCIGVAESALKAADLKVWFDLRVIRDSNKKLFGAQMAEGSLAELLPKLEARRVALRPDCRLEVRLYSTLINTRGTFMGVDIPEPPPGLVIGVASQGKPSTYARRTFKPKARAAGVVLEAKGEPPVNPPETDDALLRAAGVSAVSGGGGYPKGALEFAHVCDTKGPLKQLDPAGPFTPTCSICGV